MVAEHFETQCCETIAAVSVPDGKTVKRVKRLVRRAGIDAEVEMR